MATFGKFRMRGSVDTTDEDNSQPKVKSLFDTHRANIQSNISQATNKSPVKSQIPAASSMSTQVASATKTTSLTVNSSSAYSATSAQNASRTNGLHIPVAASQGLRNNTAIQNLGSGDNNTADKLPTSSSASTSASVSNNQSDPQPDVKLSPAKPGKSNFITVSPRQRGNPILKFVRNVPWEFGDIVPDYQMGQTTCALFLSLRYHQLNPNYVHERLKQLGHSFNLRVLLAHVDIKDPHHYLKDLAKMCLMADCTLIVAFSPEEAGRYLETYKSFENKPPDLIMERTEGNFMAQMTDCLTKARSVNKTDVMTLLSAFGSLDQIVDSSEEDLSLCPGFGPQKAARLYKVFHEPFLRAKRKVQPTSSEASTSKSSPSKKTRQTTLTTLKPRDKT